MSLYNDNTLMKGGEMAVGAVLQSAGIRRKSIAKYGNSLKANKFQLVENLIGEVV